MKKTIEKNLFVMHAVSASSMTHSGHHLVRGKHVLGQLVKEVLGEVSEDSKERMRQILEQDDEHMLAVFRGALSISIYPEVGGNMVRIFLISESRE